MELPKRLSLIASLIDDKARVIDVGCDHALLDIFLARKYSNIFCIASDVSKEVYKSTKEKIEKLGLSKQIQVVHSDGVQEIDVNNDDVLVLSGMGTHTILDILKEKTSDRMIISSHNDLFLLREGITKKGFYIYDEYVLFERGIYYVIIDFRKGKRVYNNKELEFGPLLIQKKEEIVRNYFSYLLEQCNKILIEIPENTLKFKIVKERKKIVEEILHAF